MNQLAIIKPNDWSTIMAIAPTMHACRLFGISSPEQAAAIMLKGHELGLGLAASFELIHVIDGKPTLSPRGALAVIHRSGELAGMTISETPAACSVWMKRRNGIEYTATYSLEDAQKAGLVKPQSNWIKYPGNMCRWRAIGFCADVVFPDLLGGLKRSDELGADVDSAGDVVQSSWSVSNPRVVFSSGAAVQVTEANTLGPHILEAVVVRHVEAPQIPVEPDPLPPITLDALVEMFGVDEILEANFGKVPGTDQELADLANRMSGGA